jgi:hypothetical protein
MAYNKYPLIVPIGCKKGCNGDDYPCIHAIFTVINQGNIAFMLYSEHVRSKLEQLECKIEVKEQDGIPIGMYISRKGERSVYERFN